MGRGEQDNVIVVSWWFTHSRSSATVSRTVIDGLRTMVTFSGVQREADGGKVVYVCAVFSSGIISEPATKSQLHEVQHKECGGGVTSTDLAAEENPAYKSVGVASVFVK